MFCSAAQSVCTCMLESACWPTTRSRRPNNNNRTRQQHTWYVIANVVLHSIQLSWLFTTLLCHCRSVRLSDDPHTPTPRCCHRTYSRRNIDFKTFSVRPLIFSSFFYFSISQYFISPFTLFNVHTVRTVCTITTRTHTHRAHMKLTIKHLQYGDFGNYRCISKNSLGETEGSIRVYGKWKIYWKRQQKKPANNFALLLPANWMKIQHLANPYFSATKFIWSTAFQNSSVCFYPGISLTMCHHIELDILFGSGRWQRRRRTTTTVRQGH